MVPDIEIQHLSVCFDTAQGPVYAVNDLSTTFRAGRISGVIGESGSGKSVMGMSSTPCPCGGCVGCGGRPSASSPRTPAPPWTR